MLVPVIPNPDFDLPWWIYRLMHRDKNFQPNIHVFKLLIQAANKCVIGEDKVVNDLLGA